jgi:hypothetical protein
MDYKELELYGRPIRYYNESHIEMERRMAKDKWRQVKLHKSKAGTGYYQFSLSAEGKEYKIKVHRLVFYAHNTSWDFHDGSTDNSIDHINNDSLDNRIENLRNVSHKQNHFNKPKTKGYWFEISGNKKWRAEIVVSGKRLYLGRYVEEEDARNAYLTAKAKYHVIEDN